MHIYKIEKQKRISQNYDGYFSGTVPEYGSQFLGTGSVDSSQIQGVFSKVDESINLVNRFNSSYLQNVSFIFNFSKGGAYGVYLPSLDRAIKTQALQKRLEGMGYKIEVDDKGLLTATSPNEEKDQDQIQQDIDSLYEDLESKGGSAFGINMNDVLSAAKQDAMSSGSEDSEIWQWMALLHLGSTIVHEAVHAQGYEGEGESEAAEASFTDWALPIINENYKNSLISQNKEEMYAPLLISGTKRSAKMSSWYKVAQMSYYTPQSFMNNSIGSDLSGRFPIGSQSEQGLAGWSMMAQDSQHVAIEDRLGRQFMASLPPDLNQEHDSYEEQLRKYTREDQKLDPKASLEALLSESHDLDTSTSFQVIETLLDDKRVKPLIVPIYKDASIHKKATLFGWFNNLEISDGNTIPGLSDRVMAWDDRDESFSGTEKDIRSQPRYNPRYDIKGFYYRYIEPKFHPALWNDPNEQSSGIAPAKRFAAKKKNTISDDTLKVLSILKTIKLKLDKKSMMSTRLIMTDDAISLVAKVLGQEYQISTYLLSTIDTNIAPLDNIYSVWVYNRGIPEEDIDKAEKYFNGTEDHCDLIDDLVGHFSQKESILEEVIAATKDICETYHLKDIYLIGGSVRDLVIGKNISDIESLDFSSTWPNQSIKVGNLLAERLGVIKTHFCHRIMTLSFEYRGVGIEFRGCFSPNEIKQELSKRGLAITPINMDIYNRDFTINMLSYDVLSGKIVDMSGVAINDIKSGVIKTFLDPTFVCRENPLVIMKALKLKLRYGFKIDLELEKAIIMNAPLLFDGRYSDDKLRIAKENVERENRKEVAVLFKEYGIDRIREI